MVSTAVDDPDLRTSFRFALINAASGDLIRFAANVHTIDLKRGDIILKTSLTIDGKQLPDEASSNSGFVHEVNLINSVGSRFLTVGENDNVTFSNLDLSGFVGTDPNLPGFDGQGGAFLNFGTLTLDNCNLHNNAVSSDGGAIANYGTLILNGCSIHDNAAGDLLHPGSGGGIANFRTMTISNSVTISNSTISNNTANGSIRTILKHLPDGQPVFVVASFGGLGGGISNSFGSATLINTTLSGNRALQPVGDLVLTVASGGGIYNEGTMSVTGSFVFGNSATIGGGIYNDVFATLSVDTTDFSTDGGTLPPNTPDNIVGPYSDQGGNTFI
jgi:hypothetical protein